MNIEHAVANVAIVTVLLSILAGMYFGWYKELLAHWARAELFALRDQLFDDARSGRLRFDSPAYRELWDRLNGTIRYADRLNIAELAHVQNALERRPDLKAELRQFESEWKDAQGALSRQERDVIDAIVKRQGEIVFRKVLLSSLLTIALLSPVVVTYMVLKRGVRGFVLGKLPAVEFRASKYPEPFVAS